jgi:hypothetical protein
LILRSRGSTQPLGNGCTGSACSRAAPSRADLLAIIELDEAQWKPLRRGLEQAGLIQTESLPGVVAPFLRFHPALAPALWQKPTEEERARFRTRHRQRHYRVANWLYNEDRNNPTVVRAIASRVLPNLLSAVHGALDAQEPGAVGSRTT